MISPTSKILEIEYKNLAYFDILLLSSIKSFQQHPFNDFAPRKSQLKH